MEANHDIMKSNHICLRGEPPKVGGKYQYYEEGMVAEIEIVSEKKDDEGFGYRVRVLSDALNGRAYGGAGSEFDVWSSWRFGAYSGMWRIYPDGEYVELKRHKALS